MIDEMKLLEEQRDRFNNLLSIQKYMQTDLIEAKFTEIDLKTIIYLLNGYEALLKRENDVEQPRENYMKLIEMDFCEKCDHSDEECSKCYPELGYKNTKMERDTEAVKNFCEGGFCPDAIKMALR